MYVCMHACMHACMYVYLYPWRGFRRFSPASLSMCFVGLSRCSPVFTGFQRFISPHPDSSPPFVGLLSDWVANKVTLNLTKENLIRERCRKCRLEPLYVDVCFIAQELPSGLGSLRSLLSDRECCKSGVSDVPAQLLRKSCRDSRRFYESLKKTLIRKMIPLGR